MGLGLTLARTAAGKKIFFFCYFICKVTGESGKDRPLQTNGDVVNLRRGAECHRNAEEGVFQ